MNMAESLKEEGAKAPTPSSTESPAVGEGMDAKNSRDVVPRTEVSIKALPRTDEDEVAIYPSGLRLLSLASVKLVYYNKADHERNTEHLLDSHFVLLYFL